jgi:hypothetical protein
MRSLFLQKEVKISGLCIEKMDTTFISILIDKVLAITYIKIPKPPHTTNKPNNRERPCHQGFVSKNRNIAPPTRYRGRH